MDTRFNRFLKETKVEQKKKAKLSKTVNSDDTDTHTHTNSDSDTNSDANADFFKKPHLTSDQTPPPIEWEEGGLWSWSDKKENLMESDNDGNTEEAKSLYELYRREGDKRWLKQDYPAARAAFNLINKALHPDRPLAKGVAILAAKGTSFEDKRLACLETVKGLKSNESTGEIDLIPDPKNPFDPNAVGIFDVKTGKQLGFIPKSKDVNKTYAQAITEGKFCGGYIIDTKQSYLKGEENAMLVIATGWKE